MRACGVKIRDKANKRQLMVGVYYRPPSQGELIDVTFFLQLQEVLHSQALILLGDFNYLYICWDNNMAS